MFSNKILDDFMPFSPLISYRHILPDRGNPHRNTKGTHKLSSANKHRIKGMLRLKVLTTVEKNLSQSILSSIYRFPFPSFDDLKDDEGRLLCSVE
jgi:hypothetical protein